MKYPGWLRNYETLAASGKWRYAISKATPQKRKHTKQACPVMWMRAFVNVCNFFFGNPYIIWSRRNSPSCQPRLSVLNRHLPVGVISDTTWYCDLWCCNISSLVIRDENAWNRVRIKILTAQGKTVPYPIQHINLLKWKLACFWTFSSVYTVN